MRSADHTQTSMFNTLTAEAAVPERHPIRRILPLCQVALRGLSVDFEALYSKLGRPSIPPEQLLRALLLQMLYSVRSERQLMEQLRYNLLFRWFVGLNADEPVWDATSFTKNRDRFLRGEIAQKFLHHVVEQARQQELLSAEHFTVDGTLLEAWASMKSYHKKPSPPERGTGSRGQMLRRDTHSSTTDPDACLYRKSAGGEFKLSYLGHVLMENRNGLPVAAQVTRAEPKGEWSAAVAMLSGAPRNHRRATVGADKGYDEAGLIRQLREAKVTPHVQQRKSENRTSHIDARTTRHNGYAVSLKKRKAVEHIFGWLKNTAGLHRLRHRGAPLVGWMFTLATSAYCLVRMTRLLAPNPARS